MIDLKQTLLREISTLPESRLSDVIAFVRFLKTSLGEEDTMEQEFDQAIQDARKTAIKYQITSDIIEAEIRAVRDGK